MIIMSSTCPGPGWTRVYPVYIVCEQSGRVSVPEAHMAFWTRV